MSPMSEQLLFIHYNTKQVKEISFVQLREFKTNKQQHCFHNRRIKRQAAAAWFEVVEAAVSSQFDDEKKRSNKF